MVHSSTSLNLPGRLPASLWEASFETLAAWQVALRGDAQANTDWRALPGWMPEHPGDWSLEGASDDDVAVVQYTLLTLMFQRMVQALPDGVNLTCDFAFEDVDPNGEVELYIQWVLDDGSQDKESRRIIREELVRNKALVNLDGPPTLVAGLLDKVVTWSLAIAGKSADWELVQDPLMFRVAGEYILDDTVNLQAWTNGIFDDACLRNWLSDTAFSALEHYRLTRDLPLSSTSARRQPRI